MFSNMVVKVELKRILNKLFHFNTNIFSIARCRKRFNERLFFRCSRQTNCILISTLSYENYNDKVFNEYLFKRVNKMCLCYCECRRWGRSPIRRGPQFTSFSNQWLQKHSFGNTWSAWSLPGFSQERFYRSRSELVGLSGQSFAIRLVLSWYYTRTNILMPTAQVRHLPFAKNIQKISIKYHFIERSDFFLPHL